MNGQESDGDGTSQQPADAALAFPDLKPGDAWGESITKQRAIELETILQEWEAEKEHGERNGPFDRKPGNDFGVKLNGADVFWLAEGAPTSSDQLHLEGAFLRRAHLEGAVLFLAHLENADLVGAHLEGAGLVEAHLEGSAIFQAHLEGANLDRAYLEGTNLNATHLEGVFLRGARLEGANMQLAFLDSGTALNDAVLGNDVSGYVYLADVRWGDVNLAVVEWTRTTHGFLRLRKRIEAIELGDEREARKEIDDTGKPKDKARRLQDNKDAVRANRQLATALRSQGLNEDADRFAYKAQQLQREVLRRQRRYGAAFGSWLLDIVAGYGYKPMRTLTVYLLAIITFAIAYFTLGQTVGPHLSPLGAFVFSMTSFHGRGFFPGGIVLDDPITVLAAFEAFFGLVIEVSFIATFTQRFFAR